MNEQQLTPRQIVHELDRFIVGQDSLYTKSITSTKHTTYIMHRSYIVEHHY